jgi:NAD(P)-dependent dehydrogenase (short-subunit alcohol dehydrogenase family)
MNAAGSDRKVVLITGASSGVGRATAQLLSQSGYQVFGTSRGSADAETVPGVEMLRLDVRSDDSVLACVQAAIDRAGPLDVLINNAAYELGGAVEEISLEEAKAQFETNFFGVVRMVKAVLPSMRRERRGQIINVSSFSGLSAIPFMGIYSASKFALEGFTEALRMEVKPFNIRVSLTEAAFLKTPMADKRQAPTEPIPEYEPWRRRAFKAIRGHEQKAPGPDVVAETIRRIISSEAPRLHYLIGPQAKFTSVLRWALPDGAYEQGKRSTFGLDKDE